MLPISIAQYRRPLADIADATAWHPPNIMFMRCDGDCIHIRLAQASVSHPTATFSAMAPAGPRALAFLPFTGLNFAMSDSLPFQILQPFSALATWRKKSSSRSTVLSVRSRNVRATTGRSFSWSAICVAKNCARW